MTATWPLRRDCTPPLWRSSVPCTERSHDGKLLAQVKAVVIQAGTALLDGYADTARGILKPVLTEIRPEARWAGKEQWTAVRGEGAFLNGKPLAVSAKTDVDPAIVTMPQPRTLNRRFGDAVATLPGKVQFIRSTALSTFPQLDLAAGHVDAY